MLPLVEHVGGFRGKQLRPVLTFLAGLTCTEETATMKAGAQRLAADLMVVLGVALGRFALTSLHRQLGADARAELAVGELRDAGAEVIAEAGFAGR